jgi:hypothetical protein
MSACEVDYEEGSIKRSDERSGEGIREIDQRPANSVM